MLWVLVPARNTRNTSGRNPGGDRDKADSRAKPKETNKTKEMKSLIETVEGNEGNSPESIHKVVEIKKGKK